MYLDLYSCQKTLRILSPPSTPLCMVTNKLLAIIINTNPKSVFYSFTSIASHCQQPKQKQKVYKFGPFTTRKSDPIFLFFFIYTQKPMLILQFHIVQRKRKRQSKQNHHHLVFKLYPSSQIKCKNR